MIYMAHLKESPDQIFNYNLRYRDMTALPFGYYRNKLYIGEYGSTHWEMIKDDDTLKKYNIKSRDNLKFSGRLWTSSKIISFWKYPTPVEMKKFIKDFNSLKHPKLFIPKIDSTWKVEVVGNVKFGKIYDHDNWDNEQIIYISDYLKLDVPLKKRSKKELAQQHIESPMIKGKSNVPHGVGSRKLYPGMKSRETIAQYKARTRMSEKNNKYMIIKKLLQEHIKQLLTEAADPKELVKTYVKAAKGTNLKLSNPVGLDTKFYHVYTFEFEKNGKTNYALLVFKGKNRKPEMYYAYINDRHRSEDIKLRSKTWMDNQTYHTEKVNIKDPLQVGDILVNTWGVEQTNVNFYQVTNVKGMYATFKEIESKDTLSSPDSMRGTSVPLKNKFKSGTELRKKMFNYNGITHVKIKYGSTRKWDGEPVSFTSYY